jgi:NAD(P)H-flavin reductase
MLPVPYRIRRVRQELADTFTLELAPADGSQRLTYRPGQFNMLYVFGTGEVPISVSGDPKNTKVLVHTTRAVGNVTKAMWQLKKNDVIGVRGPYGSPWPVEAAEGRDVIIVAGGIGLAPLRPAMYHILAHRDQYDKIVLLYGTRTPDDILYRPELERWRAKFDLEVHVTVDSATGDWHGNVGVVTTLIPKVPFDPTNAVAMICGPEVMMRFTALELRRRGVPLDRVFVSMERNMKCAIGLCGHCQWGTKFVCQDGPVFPYSEVKEMFGIWEL